MAKSADYHATTIISGMTIAVTQMHEMVDFYHNVLKLEFEEVNMFGATLFKAQLGAIEILFCPAELAQNTAKQNRHQLNFEIDDLAQTLTDVLKYGGQIMGDQQKDESFIQIGIKDPDNNSLVLKQKLIH